ncbi:hypothetical protein AB4142_29350, partial [Variovorax sp. 2RAF20]
VMACAQVIGHHTAITVAGQTGNFQLNVTLPLIAVNLLDGIGLLANVSTLLADSAIAGLKVREDRVAEALARNPILVTALNPKSITFFVAFLPQFLDTKGDFWTQMLIFEA